MTQHTPRLIDIDVHAINTAAADGRPLLLVSTHGEAHGPYTEYSATAHHITGSEAPGDLPTVHRIADLSAAYIVHRRVTPKELTA